MSTMSAVRAHHRGGPEQLVYEQAPRPAPAAGEVLVAVRATWTDSLAPPVDHVVSLPDTPAAYEALQTEHKRGKILIHVAEP
ncbi:hypothetical protein [Dactylosporangium sp. CA-139066]|uniref:hypothetical protein n=1 Tax=Dactylosporangium sp. CA-139066 TaxID=3239930 RepID=UPI003D8A04F9